MKEKKIQTHNFENEFNNLPGELQKKVAGFLFHVPKYAMNSIDSDNIIKDENELKRLTT